MSKRMHSCSVYYELKKHSWFISVHFFSLHFSRFIACLKVEVNEVPSLQNLLPSFSHTIILVFHCQTVVRSAQKSSQDDAITKLWKNTNCGTNIQYDTYKNTKHVLKLVRADHAENLQSKPPSQGSSYHSFLRNP